MGGQLKKVKRNMVFSALSLPLRWTLPTTQEQRASLRSCDAMNSNVVTVLMLISVFFDTPFANTYILYLVA